MYPDADSDNTVTPPQRPVPAPPPGPVPGPAYDTAVVRAERAVAALEHLDQLPVPEHVARFDAAHAALAEALASIDKV